MKAELVAKISQEFPDATHEVALDFDIFTAGKNDYLKLAGFLKNESDLAFDHLSCLSGVDYLDCLGVVCHFYSYSLRHRVCLKTRATRDEPEVGSLTSLWATAGWHEREAWDLYGIVFKGHPDLRRILSSDDQPGHPFRKDVPLENDEEWLLRDERTQESYGFSLDQGTD